MFLFRIFCCFHFEFVYIALCFQFDCCDGGDQRERTRTAYRAKSRDRVSSTSGPILVEMGKALGSMDPVDKDTPKNVTMNTIKKGRGWTTTTKNEDYNLAVVHAANSGYIAKSRSDQGSYLIQRFTIGVERNIERKLGWGLAELFEKIQNDLHDRGKQQTVNVFNNNMRTLQLKVNEK